MALGHGENAGETAARGHPLGSARRAAGADHRARGPLVKRLFWVRDRFHGFTVSRASFLCCFFFSGFSKWRPVRDGRCSMRFRQRLLS